MGGMSEETATTLLVWDAPNVDMALGHLLNGKPAGHQRPRFDVLGRWLLDLAGDGEAEATVFTNVAPGSATFMRPWVETLRSLGYAVFAKPKLAEGDDIDDEMLDHIGRRREEGRLRRLVVASGDGRNFREPLEALAATGVEVTVLGFVEQAGYALASSALAFVDLEDIEGMFTEPLPRTRLDALPASGAWLAPTRPLRALLGAQVAVSP